MNATRTKGYLFGGGMSLVTIVLLFSGFLNIESFRKTYLTSIIGSYSVSGGEARRQGVPGRAGVGNHVPRDLPWQ